jgi:predicted HTH domain antitoxin
MQITLDLPDSYLIPQTTEPLVQQLKLYAALFLFQTGQLSRGAACELAGTDIYSFLAACKQYQIPVINYPAEDLAEELARFNARHPK